MMKIRYGVSKVAASLIVPTVSGQYEFSGSRRNKVCPPVRMCCPQTTPYQTAFASSSCIVCCKPVRVERLGIL